MPGGHGPHDRLDSLIRASATCGVSGSWACDAKQWQDSGGVAGIAAQRGGDVAMAAGVQDADGEDT